METIYIAGNIAVTKNDCGNWCLIQTELLNGRVMVMKRDTIIKVSFGALNIASLMKLHEAFKFDMTTPEGLLPAIEKELEKRNAPLYQEIKDHVIKDIIENIVKINRPAKEEAPEQSKREILLKQIAEGLEVNAKMDQIASLGYCSVVKKHADVKYRWSIVTPKILRQFKKVDEMLDFILKNFW